MEDYESRRLLKTTSVQDVLNWTKRFWCIKSFLMVEWGVSNWSFLTSASLSGAGTRYAAVAFLLACIQDYSLSMYLRQQWLDSRLSFDRAANHNSTTLKLQDNTWDRIWIPEVVFRNEKRATFHHVTTANRMMRLHDSGKVWYVSKWVAVTAFRNC